MIGKWPSSPRVICSSFKGILWPNFERCSVMKLFLRRWFTVSKTASCNTKALPSMGDIFTKTGNWNILQSLKVAQQIGNVLSKWFHCTKPLPDGSAGLCFFQATLLVSCFLQPAGPVSLAAWLVWELLSIVYTISFQNSWGPLLRKGNPQPWLAWSETQFRLYINQDQGG